MKGLYLYTKSDDRRTGPIQNPMAEGEIRVVYVDNRRVAVVRAIPSDSTSCFGCYLNGLSETTKGCMIPTERVGDTAIGAVCCGSEKVILKNVEEILEEL